MGFHAVGVDADLEEDERLVIYRVVQEALSNAVRHSQARTIEVNMAVADGVLQVRVQDDGQGFDAQERALSGGGMGLTGMRERASLVGGDLSITSEPGEGTTVDLQIPTSRREAPLG